MPNTITWEQRKLEEFSKTTIGEFVIKTKQNPNSKYPVYNGGVSYTGFYDDFNNNGHKIIVSARGANAGFINIINGKYWAGNSRYSIDIQDNYCIEYVYHFMKHKQHLFTDFQQAANIPSVSKKDVEEFLISYPKSKEEQTQIGNFFKQLDDTIALHQRELEKFKILKTSYLENIFLGKVSLFTAKNTITWEQRKLEDVSFSYSGGTPSVNNLSFYGGSIPFIRSGEINDETTELFITEEGLNNSSAKLVEKGNILYALYGATSGEVGRAKIHGAINQAILAIVPYVNYDSEFIAQWLRRNKYSIISTYLQGGQGNLSGEIVKNLILELPPSKEEQTKIGNFFKQLDDTIALHQKELAKYQQIKAACLEKMFVE